MKYKYIYILPMLLLALAMSCEVKSPVEYDNGIDSYNSGSVDKSIIKTSVEYKETYKWRYNSKYYETESNQVHVRIDSINIKLNTQISPNTASVYLELYREFNDTALYHNVRFESLKLKIDTVELIPDNKYFYGTPIYPTSEIETTYQLYDSTHTEKDNTGLYVYAVASKEYDAEYQIKFYFHKWELPDDEKNNYGFAGYGKLIIAY